MLYLSLARTRNLNSLSLSFARTHTYTNAHTHTHSHTRTHTRTHACIHAHTHNQAATSRRRPLSSDNYSLWHVCCSLARWCPAGATHLVAQCLSLSRARACSLSPTLHIFPPKNGEIALWPSTNGSIPYISVLADSESTTWITDITSYRFIIGQSSITMWKMS